MVALPAGYCIDSTEVTRGQYQAWLDSSPSLDQNSTCAWKPSFESESDCMEAAQYCDLPSLIVNVVGQHRLRSYEFEHRGFAQVRPLVEHQSAIIRRSSHVAAVLAIRIAESDAEPGARLCRC